MPTKTTPDFRDADLTQLLEELANGSQDAAWKIAKDFTPHIVSAVRASLPTKLRRRLDSEDFIQLVWASLLLRGNLSELKTPAQLIAYVSQTARHKVIDMSRRHLATQKYDLNREQSLDQPQSTGHDRHRDANLYTNDPTPSQAASVRERWQRVLASASERDRQVLELLLEGQSNDEIGRTLSMHPGSVRRVISRFIDSFSK